MDAASLARMQFAFTALYHYLFVPLSIGLGLIVAIMTTKAYKSHDAHDEARAQFWTRLFTMTFAVGVATGITMEFSFGTNWAGYSRFVGDIFGAPLAAEALFAFFLESVFLGVLLFVFDLFGPLKALYGEATRLTVMNAALDRIEAVLDEPELPDNGNQHILSQAQPDQPEVQFSDVGFAYQDKEVLHNISFSMQKNTMTALVGPSGGGKSTIANLLARL